VFLSSTRAILAQVEPRRDQFLAHGMAPTVLDDLNTLVGHYEDAMAEKGTGISTHVGANAELDVVAGEIMIIIHLLDRLNQVRFRKNTQLLAAWASAKEVVGPGRPAREEETTPEATDGGVEEPAA
jgi:hypothetical protein